MVKASAAWAGTTPLPSTRSLSAAWSNLPASLAGTDLAATSRCARATIRVLRASGWRGRATTGSAAWAFACYGLGHPPRDEISFVGLYRARRWVALRASVLAAR